MKEGISVLQEKLKDLDPETYRKIDLENSQRLMRALEVCLGTGLPYSSFLTDQISQRNFIPIKIGLTAPGHPPQVDNGRPGEKLRMAPPDFNLGDDVVDDVVKTNKRFLQPFADLNQLRLFIPIHSCLHSLCNI